MQPRSASNTSSSPHAQAGRAQSRSEKRPQVVGAQMPSIHSPPVLAHSTSGATVAMISQSGPSTQPTPGPNTREAPQSHAGVAWSQACEEGTPHSKCPHHSGRLNQAPPVAVQRAASHDACAAWQAATVAYTAHSGPVQLQCTGTQAEPSQNAAVTGAHTATAHRSMAAAMGSHEGT